MRRDYHNMITFPYGLSNFKKIVDDGDYYVDKTQYIELMELWGDDLISFLRPRRIGKSLFVSILEYYYDIRHKDKFEHLFGKYYIGKNPTKLANSFAVLKMDFSGIDTTTEERAYAGFLSKVSSYADVFNKNYQCFDAATIEVIQSQPSPEMVMKKFFDAYNGTPIYLILDEYDHFTNEILLQDLRQFKKAVTKNGYVRKFYETIKEASQQGIINKIFITGVSPVTLDSLTSDFNIIKHLTNELEFHDMMGFTEAEVSKIIEIILLDKSQKERIMEDLRNWYNGYKFHKRAKQRIYNAVMVLYFCSHFQRYQKYPDEMLDPNIAPDYGKLKKMFEIQDAVGNYELLNRVIYEEKVHYKLIFQFSFDRKFSDAQFISFLYYMGYLTIGGESRGLIEFVVPNLVIQELYWEYFSWLITEREQIPYDEGHVQQIIGEMTIGNLAPFQQLITEVLNKLSNRDYQQFDEKYIKVVMISFIAMGGIYHIKSEAETTKGYIDMLLLAPPTKNIDLEYIFELKYIKKSDATKEQIEAKQAEARAQILKYIKSDPSIKDNPKMRAYTMVFVKSELLIEEVIFQDI